MTNKEKYEANKSKTLKKRTDKSDSLARAQQNLQALRDKNASTAKVIPKGHPFSPQIEDTTVLPKVKPIYGTPDYVPQRKINHG